MLKWIKNLLKFRQYNAELSAVAYKLNQDKEDLAKNIDELVKKNRDLVRKLNDPSSYIPAIMNRDITWFDYNKLDQARKMNYYSDAQNIFNGETFNNEINHYIADLVKFCATMEGIDPENKLLALMNIQSTIVGIETLKDRLGKIENPMRKSEEVDEFSAI